MKIQVRRQPFLKGCRLAERVFPPRLVESSFGRLLLQAHASSCTLYAVGSEVALRLEMPATVAEAGEAMLSARHALAVAREADAEELTLESGDGLVRARGEGAEFVLETPGPIRHSASGSTPEGVCQLLPADLLSQAIRRTLFAVGRATARYNLQGMLWEVEADQVRLIATDNKRLAAAEVPAQSADEQFAPLQRLLPARAMDLLRAWRRSNKSRSRLSLGRSTSCSEWEGLPHGNGPPCVPVKWKGRSRIGARRCRASRLICSLSRSVPSWPGSDRPRSCAKRKTLD